ncbi:MAG: site-specific integrase [Nevskia sp.]|nr:site-specific integrase [Nevskia sp.]
MGIYKRGDVWWVRFTAPDGERVRKSAGSVDKRAAQELHDRLKADAWRQRKLGQRPDYTWEDAVVQWLKEKGHKASLKKDKEILCWVDRYLRGKRLSMIDRPLLFQLLEAKAAEGSKATANRHMALVRAILRRACEVWEWTERTPKAPMYSVQDKRTRWITWEEAERLLGQLPEHQAQMMRFALATGLRQRNVCRLEWSAVDLGKRCAWVHADQTKTRKAIAVPLNADAMAVLEQREGVDGTYVFTYQGRPVWQVNTKSWRKAVKRAGLQDFRWHDLRHTWASRHAQAGTPLNVLQELGGWRSHEMVLRYAHLSSGHLLAHAERIARGEIGGGDGVPPEGAQIWHNERNAKVVPLCKSLI